MRGNTNIEQSEIENLRGGVEALRALNPVYLWKSVSTRTSTNLIFDNIPQFIRRPGVIIGNSNGVPVAYIIALEYNTNTTSWQVRLLSITGNNTTATIEENSDGTGKLTLSGDGISTWGNYILILFN